MLRDNKREEGRVSIGIYSFWDSGSPQSCPVENVWIFLDNSSFELRISYKLTHSPFILLIVTMNVL